MSGFGSCFGCKRPFTFNVERVPSFKGEPICRDCIRRVNEKRRALGLPEWPVLPGAYEPEEVA
jgi:hypothetical protein